MTCQKPCCFTQSDGHGGGGAAKRSGTRRRKLRSFYFRTGTVVRTTTDNGRDVTAQCQVGGHVDCKKILNMTNGGTQAVHSHFLKCHTVLNVKIRGLHNTVGADQNSGCRPRSTTLPETAHNGETSHREDRRRDAEFAEEYGEGVQTVDRVSKTKVGQNVHQGDSTSGLTSPGG